MIHPGVHRPFSNQTIVYGQTVAQALPALLKQFWVSQAILVVEHQPGQTWRPGSRGDSDTGVRGRGIRAGCAAPHAAGRRDPHRRVATRTWD